MASLRNEIINELKSISGDRVKTNFSLSKYTSFGLGGNCAVFINVHSETELSHLLRFCFENGLKYFILGNGTNILVSDRGFDGVVLKLDGLFNEYVFSHSGVWAGASCSVNLLIEKSLELGYSGLEPLYGIPATLGGALKMNASAFGCSIGSFVKRFVAFDKRGRGFVFEPSHLEWGYKKSPVGELVVSRALISLKEDKPENINSRIKEFYIRRKQTQPLNERSAGCVFKNPSENLSASAIIDSLGIKGERIGGAYVSEKHANFIVAREGATASDVFKLMMKIKRIVLEKKGINLEPELILLGEFEYEKE